MILYAKMTIWRQLRTMRKTASRQSIENHLDGIKTQTFHSIATQKGLSPHNLLNHQPQTHLPYHLAPIEHMRAKRQFKRPPANINSRWQPRKILETWTRNRRQTNKQKKHTHTDDDAASSSEYNSILLLTFCKYTKQSILRKYCSSQPTKTA